MDQGMLACPHASKGQSRYARSIAIIIRGIERKPIFKDKIDYGNFIDRLSKILVDTDAACFAWALITSV